MGASILPSLYRRMRGLLFSCRFSCVVIRFLGALYVYGKTKKREGAELGERKKEGGEWWSIERNQVPAQKENKVENWMDYTLGNDRAEQSIRGGRLCL